MSGNPFQDLQNAIASLGIDSAIAGIVLGFSFSVVLGIILMFALDPKGKDKSGFIMLISFGLGIGISTGVGWFNDAIYIPVIFVFVLAFIMLDPFGSRRGSSSG